MYNNKKNHSQIVNTDIEMQLFDMPSHNNDTWFID